MPMNNLNSTKNSDVLREDTQTIQEELPKYKISHLVSANKLKVYIRIEMLDKQAEVSCEDIFAYLSEQNIVYGIMKDEIISYCSRKEYSKELIAAIGTAPVDGKDAQLVYDFDISGENRFDEDADGTINFRNLNNVKNVTKNEVLCRIIPPEDGKDGIDVYGETVNYRRGSNVSFNYGSNTYISEDGFKLLAATDGCVEFKNSKVFVESVYKVNNVDNSTGNIDFIGSVVINGDVKEGFSVKAKGDIKIKGMVEGAYIESGGEVVISKGMNGMGKGKICAKGNITSKYIENSFIETGGSVFAEALINSDVKAGDSIILKGATAAIIGGISRADNLIYAKTIGGKTNPETNIVLNLDKYQDEQRLLDAKRKMNARFEKDLAAKTSEMKELDDKMDLITNSFLDEENKSSVKRQIMLMKIKVGNEISDIKQQMTDVVATDNIADHKIICKGVMYPNTRLTIGWMKYRIREDLSFTKIYNDGNDITFVPLNPADIDI